MVALINFAAADFRDYDEYSEAELLADYVEAYNEPIISDRITAGRARTQLRLRGYTPDEIRALLPYFAAPNEGALLFRATPAGVQYKLAIAGEWEELARAAPRNPSWTKAILKRVVPMSWRPERLKEILQTPNPVVLYKAGDGATVEHN